jgi:hypothetical protein
LLKGDRSSCDDTFFLKVNRYKASFREIASEGIHDVELFR